MKELKVDKRIESFVKTIYLLEGKEGEHCLPFFADGYPGLMFSKNEDGVVLQPGNKKLSSLFLYGQTIEPIKLLISGAYKLLVFQLYPFATRILLNIDPKEINDKCFDLNDLKMVDTAQTTSTLKSLDTKKQVLLLEDYILQIVKHSTVDSDNSIKLAITTLINSKGKITIKDLREQLYISERTFERKFAKEIGVTPKQFAKIIQFSFSLNQLQESDYYSLTDIAYNNNFTDQSHFIKTFKKYTGQSPKAFLSQIS